MFISFKYWQLFNKKKKKKHQISHKEKNALFKGLLHRSGTVLQKYLGLWNKIITLNAIDLAHLCPLTQYSKTRPLR